MVKKELTKAELLVMKCIWDTPKEMVLSEIVAMVNERYNKDWKPQTVSTYIAHLVMKDFLKMHKNGRTYTYEVLVPEKQYRTQAFEDFKEFWGINSIVDFLSAYCERNEVTEEEYGNLKALIDSI